MGTININVPRSLNGEQAGDIAITAAEGGIGYWALLDSYRPRLWTSRLGPNEDVAENFVFYTIVGVTEGDLDDLRDECLKYDVDMDLVVTPALIARGIGLYLAGVEHYNRSMGWQFQPRAFADMEEFEAMDSDEADCVIQLGAFGHLVYG